eukprot:TRINITY_DN79162_c0_g1_i1.p1 TRINITY_DN79162_c0_g1~~TRINITY_DN79162_c0_g1_i1.p1  ORF type:complete len:325 (+),score=107.85 TRINITY_DN79162_c0_g1_i1:47-1021(+)
MNLLGGYGSSEEEGEEIKATDVHTSAGGSSSSSSRATTVPQRCGQKSRKVVLDYRRLPISRPLVSAAGPIPDVEKIPEPDQGLLEKAAEEEKRREEEAQRIAEQEDEEQDEEEGSSWFQPGMVPTAPAPLLPAPKLPMRSNADTVQTEKQQQGEVADEVDIDFSSLGRAREKPQTAPGATAWLLKKAVSPTVRETATEIPASILKHPMLRGLRDSEELECVSSNGVATHVNADAMRDPSWELNKLVGTAGQTGFIKGAKVPSEVSMYEADRWEESGHANVSRYQKRKHQINWLANEAIESEAELLDRLAAKRQEKYQTAAKYGW